MIKLNEMISIQKIRGAIGTPVAPFALRGNSPGNLLGWSFLKTDETLTIFKDNSNFSLTSAPSLTGDIQVVIFRNYKVYVSVVIAHYLFFYATSINILSAIDYLSSVFQWGVGNPSTHPC